MISLGDGSITSYGEAKQSITTVGLFSDEEEFKSQGVDPKLNTNKKKKQKQQKTLQVTLTIKLYSVVKSTSLFFNLFRVQGAMINYVR